MEEAHNTVSAISLLDQIFHTLQYTFFFYWELFQYLNHQDKPFLSQKALKNKNKLLSLPVEIGIFCLTQIIPH